MIKIILKIFTYFVFLAAGLFIFSDIVFACGPILGKTIYTSEDVNGYYPVGTQSDYSYEGYGEDLMNEKYGIIQTDWGPEFLYPVYRQLTDKEFTPEEKEKLLSYYQGNYYDAVWYLQFANSGIAKDSIERWEEARRKVVAGDVEIQSYRREAGGWSSFLNCMPDAFETAAETLDGRLDVYTRDQLEEWVRSQDSVFESCGSAKALSIIKKINAPNPVHSCGEGKLSQNKDENSKLLTAAIHNSMFSFFSNIWDAILGGISGLANSIVGVFNGAEQAAPKDKGEFARKATPESERLLAMDKEYQEAAKDFYEWNLEEAETMFKKISETSNHAWREYAALALGRTYIRMGHDKFQQGGGVFSQHYQNLRNAEFRKAKAQFEKILADETLEAAVHESARSLIGYVDFRLNPRQRIKDAEANLLNDTTSASGIVNNLEDFSLLWYDALYNKWFFENKAKYNYYNIGTDNAFNQFSEYVFSEMDDFSQWVYVWWNPMEENFWKFSLKKYEDKKSLAWLLASLRHLNLDDARSGSVLREARAIPKDFPVYYTAKYYYYKSLIANAAADSDEAQLAALAVEIDSLVRELETNETLVIYNSFNDLRMTASGDLKEAVSYSKRKLIGWDYYDGSPVVLGSGEGRGVVWHMDDKMKRVFNELLPLSLWAEMSFEDLPLEIARNIRIAAFSRAIILEEYEIANKIAPLFDANGINEYLKASDNEEKKFTASVFMLENGASNMLAKPEASRYFWCAFSEGDAHGLKEYDIDALSRLVSEADKQKAKTELKVMAPLSGINYFMTNIIAYAEDNPNDSRVPEALHLGVRATRSASCKTAETGGFSRRAFQILHQKYQNSEWTDKTPYWYK